ncbi:MAG: ImmA/IrrE family metallo-endopeptidase [Phycisphaerales bacterium]|nr:ImmA/IrrE family metallo-endopeptidase [Phycisphaerales bacterium]
MLRVPVKPELLRWACERAGKLESALAERFAAFPDWLTGEKQPTFKQLEDFAKATRTPFGFFFLQEPPVETIPIPDFRTVGSERVQHPSPDLLDTIYLCQQRQDWYRQNALVLGEPPLDFIGSATVQSEVIATASRIREAVGFDLDARAEARKWEDALRMMIDAADEAGILVMISGIVGHNTHRPLDTAEFRGFALCDASPHLAPLIFINGTDTKAGQMFTLAHELAHLWIGESGVSNVTPASSFSDRGVEWWCHAVATEIVRGFDVPDGRGSVPAVSPRFARAVLASTWEGRSAFTDAFRLLGCRNVKALEALGDRLGMTATLCGGAA